jgi:hypothetical protein
MTEFRAWIRKGDYPAFKARVPGFQGTFDHWEEGALACFQTPEALTGDIEAVWVKLDQFIAWCAENHAVVGRPALYHFANELGREGEPSFLPRPQKAENGVGSSPSTITSAVASPFPRR